MRKLLLASAAIMSASVGAAGHAYAQAAAQSAAPVATTATSDSIGDSIVTLDSGSASANDSTDGQSFPTPGTVTVRLNGRYRFYAFAAANGAAGHSNFTGISSANSASNGVGNTNTGINKVASYGVMQYARLYPGFDGVAANGLKYGASMEIREEGNNGAGGGAFGGVSAAERSSADIYLRRQFGYLATDQLGTLRLGTSDGVSSLMMTGTFENFDAGGWNGDIEYALPGADQLNWPFNDVGNAYATMKVIYLSPQFYGFDFGIDWEPTTQGGGGSAPGCGGTAFAGSTFIAGGKGVASEGCNALSSTSTADQARRRNEVEASFRYRGSFGPIGLATTLSLLHSGHVNFDGIAPTQNFQDLNWGSLGATVTYGGLSVGGIVKMGDYDGEGDGNLTPDGAKMSTAWLAGASYTVGPVIMGASYVDYIHPNGAVPSLTVGSEREQGRRPDLLAGTRRFDPRLLPVGPAEAARREPGAELGQLGRGVPVEPEQPDPLADPGDRHVLRLVSL